MKTRLAAEIGAAAAAAVYRRLAERVLAQTAPLAGEYERLVFFAPADAGEEVSRWLPRETLLAQQGDDLGARMDSAFAEAFARGATRVVLVGSDVPRLSRAHVGEALAALESRPLALGPSMDGGYYLIGLRRRQPELFRGIAWGEPDVEATTLERGRGLGLAAHRLPLLRDVDTKEDLAAEGLLVLSP